MLGKGLTSERCSDACEFRYVALVRVCSTVSCIGNTYIDGSTTFIVIQKDGLNFLSLYFKIRTSDSDSLFAQIGDSNDECCSSLEVEC